MTEFYVFRYLASEAFLPGYNFTRLPVRVFLGEGDGGDYVSRPRFIALREFGPHNIIYHKGEKFRVNQLIVPEVESHITSAKVCTSSGYWMQGPAKDRERCPLTGVDLTSSEHRKDFSKLVELTESLAQQTEHITCEEEERRRQGFETEIYFCVPDSDMSRIRKACLKSGNDGLLNLSFIPAARLIQVSIRDRSRKDEGFPIGMTTGQWKSSTGKESKEDVQRVMLFTDYTADALYIEPIKGLALERAGIISLQYALKRAIETVFQIEPRELEVTEMGETPNIFLYEASEGSLGVLSQFAGDVTVFHKVIDQAVEICRFDDKDYLEKASYDDLLSYFNQPHHLDLDRFLIRDALERLKACSLELQTNTTFESYEDHYRQIRTQVDPNSSTEAKFIDYLYEKKLRLPDSAQRVVAGIYVKPDFFYEPDYWVFCDGTPHDDPAIQKDDQMKRQAIRNRGDEVIVYYYKDQLDSLVTQYPDVFKPATTAI